MKCWCISILPIHAIDIPTLEISPLGLAHQANISKSGEIVKKYRVIDDLSFPGISSETSINKRMDKDTFS